MTERTRTHVVEADFDGMPRLDLAALVAASDVALGDHEAAAQRPVQLTSWLRRVATRRQLRRG